MYRILRHAVIAAVGLLLSPLIHAQAVPVIEVETHLVNMALSVLDAQGKVVPDLGKEDFTVVEDGVPQTIRFFAHNAQLPLSIGLIIDVSGSQKKFVKDHETAIEAFLQQVLAPDDQAFAVCFGNRLRLVSDFSDSPGQIILGIHTFDKNKSALPELGPHEQRDLGTALYDAVFYGITEKLTGIHQRRKVLIVLSDGEENSSGHDLLDAIGAAQNADVLVYAIRYTEVHHGATNVRDRYGVRVLDHLTQLTGGRVFDADTVKLHDAFASIARTIFARSTRWPINRRTACGMVPFARCWSRAHAQGWRYVREPGTTPAEGDLGRSRVHLGLQHTPPFALHGNDVQTQSGRGSAW